MALVDDDQVKKSRREFPKELLAFFRSGNRLIQAEVDLVGSIDPALFVECSCQINLSSVLTLDGFCTCAEFRHRSTKRPKIVDHCLVNENVSVSQVDDAPLSSSLPEPP